MLPGGSGCHPAAARRAELNAVLHAHTLTGARACGGAQVGAAQNVFSKSSKYSLFDPCKEMAYIPLDEETQLKVRSAPGRAPATAACLSRRVVSERGLHVKTSSQV